jgi:hypothetical protein
VPTGGVGRSAGKGESEHAEEVGHREKEARATWPSWAAHGEEEKEEQAGLAGPRGKRGVRLPGLVCSYQTLSYFLF